MILLLLALVWTIGTLVAFVILWDEVSPLNGDGAFEIIVFVILVGLLALAWPISLPVEWWYSSKGKGDDEYV